LEDLRKRGGIGASNEDAVGDGKRGEDGGAKKKIDGTGDLGEGDVDAASAEVDGDGAVRGGTGGEDFVANGVETGRGRIG